MVHSQRGNKAALAVFEPDSFVPLAAIQDDNYWYQCDQIGTPRELSDQSGEIVGRQITRSGAKRDYAMCRLKQEPIKGHVLLQLHGNQPLRLIQRVGSTL